MLFVAVHESGCGTKLPFAAVKTTSASGVQRSRNARCETFSF
jgi:hypothetical protein